MIVSGAGCCCDYLIHVDDYGYDNDDDGDDDDGGCRNEGISGRIGCSGNDNNSGCGFGNGSGSKAGVNDSDSICSGLRRDTHAFNHYA